ncbi:MAG: DMT family transporter [Oscillospiraceae bacterium]|nr:DMT family transporter [Oscillospiraceae bacterium]
MKKETAGILQMILCAMLWSIAGIFIKLLPWNGFAVASLRSLLAGLTIAVYMMIRRYPFCLNRHTLISGVLAGSVYVCFATANKLTTAANAIVLQFTAPVFIVVFSAILYKTRIRRGDLAVVLIVLAGITLFFFDQLGPSSVLGNFVAIAAGMFMAGMYMTIDRLEQTERFSAIVIGQAFAFLVGLPAVIATHPVLSTVTVLSILALGIFQLGISYVLYVRASENCPALACSLLGAVEPLLNPIWVMLFDGEKPGIFALLGGVVVITAVTAWCIWDGKQKAQPA